MNKSRIGQSPASSPAEDPSPTFIRAAVVIITGIGMMLRLAFINQPMRQDEADTVMQFALHPVWNILIDTSLPNNHILHTIMVKASVEAFGLEPWAVRLPAFLSGIAAIPVTYLAGRALHSAGAGLVGAAIVAASSPLVLFSTNARGYSLVVLTTLLAILALRVALEKGGVASWGAFALLTAASMVVTPAALFAASGTGLWAMLEIIRRRDWLAGRHLLAASAVAASLVCAAYTPAVAVSGLGSIVGNRFVTALSWSEFLESIPPFAADISRSWSDGWPVTASIVVAIAAFTGLMVRPRAPLRVTVALVMLVSSVVLMCLMRRVPYPRVLLFIVPFLGISTGAAVMRAWRTPLRGSNARAAGIVAIVTALALGWSVNNARSPELNDETNRFPAAEDIAEFLMDSLRPSDVVVARWSPIGPVSFYLKRNGRRALFAEVGDTVRGRLIVIASDNVDTSMAVVLAHRQLVGLDTSVVREAGKFNEARVWMVDSPARRLSPSIHP